MAKRSPLHFPHNSIIWSLLSCCHMIIKEAFELLRRNVWAVFAFCTSLSYFIRPNVQSATHSDRSTRMFYMAISLCIKVGEQTNDLHFVKMLKAD